MTWVIIALLIIAIAVGVANAAVILKAVRDTETHVLNLGTTVSNDVTGEINAVHTRVKSLEVTMATRITAVEKALTEKL